MKKLNIFFLIFATILFVSNTGQAQSVEEILDNYFVNTGGKANWEALKTMKMVGKLQIPSQGLEFPGTMLQKYPNKQKLTFEVQGQALVQAFDGNEGWGTNFMNGSVEKSDAEENEISKRDNEFNTYLDYSSLGYTFELEGTEEIEGVECFKLKLTRPPLTVDGEEVEDVEYHFFDSENFVPIMVRSTGKRGEGKGIEFETYMSDYDEAGDSGLYMPYSIMTKVDGNAVQGVTLESIETNIDIDDSEFAFPEE